MQGILASNYIIPFAILVCVFIFMLVWKSDRETRVKTRIARVTNKKPAASQKAMDVLSLRRKSDNTSFINKITRHLPNQTALRARLERAGLQVSTDRYITLSGIAIIVAIILALATHHGLFAGILLGIVVGVVLPHIVVGAMGNKRIKKFLILFPDTIDFIVRGLKSGLPVTESMNIVGREMEEPVGSIFANMGESIRLGVPIDKALQDTAAKLQSTEFNFFVTSIILQRETGGNLSEILSNLSDVLRKRMMMRLKIKAMSSEAKASALIVGSLPFLVISALLFLSPGYLDPLVDTLKGNMVAAGAMFSLGLGLTIMIKMTHFEI
jgi:tight adherence protein B